jgi:UDP-GlcNAc:undecaprenyl-phosphate GlcNAc-1-phosphate transferase
LRTYLVAFLMALGIAALATPIALQIGRRLHLYDAPDGRRKIHTGLIARTGGLAIAAGFLAPLLGLLFVGNAFAADLKANEVRMTAFLAGAVAILLLGVYDDVRGVGAGGKLVVQAAVGGLLWWAGLRFETVTLGGDVIAFGMWSLPLTILWVAGIINAMNLIDGLDGLAAGVAFFAALSLFIISLLDGNMMLGLFSAALAGSVLGFLFYNFSPALIFMGDSGSMTIGYVFAAAALWSAGKRSTALALALPVLALGLPIADTVLAFTRRTLNGQSPFHSDRKHIHHRLLDTGMSQRKAVLVLYGLCLTLTVVVVLIRMYAW